MTEEQTVGAGSPAESSGQTSSDSAPETGSGAQAAESPTERPSFGATLARRWKVVAAVLPALGFALAVARYYRGCEADRQARTGDTWAEVRAASESPVDLSRTANIREHIETLHRAGESFRGLHIENFRLRTPTSPGRTSPKRRARTPISQEPASPARTSAARP